MTTPRQSRRQFLGLATACFMTPLLAPAGWTSDTEPLSEDEPIAKALGYHVDAANVSKITQPSFKPGSTCLNCMQYKTLTPGTGTCALFPGKSVSADGWCKAWVKKA